MSDKERLHELVELAGELETKLLLDLAERWVGLGQTTYGKILPGTGRDWVRDTKEELLDAVFYLKMAEIDGQEVGQ